MSRIIYTVDKSVLSSFTFFKPNQIIEKAAKGSQKAEHEYKYRYPNAKGGWDYVYDNESEKIKELFSNPLEKLSTIFKLAKEKVHTLYVNHGIKASYNATEKDFAKHILEYKLNKERWDKRFEKLETNQKHKNPVKLNGGKTTQRIQKEVKEVTGQDKKESGEFKPNASLMRKVWAIFNKEKAAESDRKAESENQKKVKETFDAYADVLKNGGRLNISNPKLGNVVFDAGVLGDLTKKNKGGFGIRHLIASRYLKDGMNTDDICALLYLVKDTVETALPPDTEKSKINLKKDGIWVGISKEWNGEKENWIITGFPENDSEGNITKEAADTIKTVNAQYGYALEHSPIREQVGAVIASINTIASADNSVKPKESEIEAHENRSQAMMGNQNARKYGISDKSWNYLQRHFEEFENAGRNIITDTGAIDSDFYRAVMNPDTYLTPEQQKEKFAATDEFDAVFAQNGFKKVSEMLIAMYNDYKGATNAENNTGIEPGRLSDSNEPVQSEQLEGNSNKDVHSTENRADRNEPLFSSDESGNGLGRPNSTSDRGRGRITKAQARKIREQCREILKKPDSEITESDKEILSQYVGAGGTDEEDSSNSGVLYEFYTPRNVIKKVWQLVDKGTGLLAYDVGVGKTATGIVATVNQIQTGRAKRPLICVPKPTYTNWIRTIKQLFPNIKVNELENMSAKHVSNDFVPEEGSISVCTYEGVENISFNDSEMESLKQDIETVNFYDTGDKKESKRQQASRDEKNETQLGEMTKTRDAGVPFSQMGFDHITVDEVHNFRNLFRMPRRLHNKIATEDNEDIEEEDVSKQSNEFGALGTGGEPSNRAKKLFAITQLIQKKNEGRNTFLLSATPFQNSPLEIYSILSFMARDKLKDLGIYSLEQFVGQFCKLQSEYAVKANKIQEKLVMKDFNNLCALQNLITEYIDKVDGEAAGVIRPYKRTHTPELEMTELQKEIMAQCSEYIAEQEELPKDDRDPGYMFRAMNAMRNCALSPALVDVDFFPDPADKPPMSEIVESSPKLKFVCDSVIGQYKQNSKNGQVIYMPSGVEQFPEVRDYLVKNGIPRDAIALMAGGATTDKAMNARQAVIDEFNDVEGKTKVIIGSSTIKEGINLQGNSTVIYNTQLDWNPTDAQQVEGRIWRQGNKQGITHIVYPLMYDSIDSMIYQKYDEKSSRLDALFSYQGDTLNVADINPEELKFGLIKDPEKRADLQVMEFTDKNRNDAKMYSQLIDVLHRQVEIAFQSDDVLAKKANDAMHSWSFSVESHTKRYEEENAEAKKYKKLYDELVKKYKGKEDTFENNGAYYTRRNGKEGYEEALTYIGRSYESHKASANNYKETLTHYNKELKKLTDSRESCRKFLANKGINNEADCDAKIKTYVQFMETAKANIEKAKTMRAQFLEEAIKDNKAKEKVLPSLDEMIKDNISSIMNDLHPMDDEFKARRQDENDRLFKRGKYAETPVSKSLDGLKIEFINYVEKEAAKEFYQKSFDGVADRVQFLSNVRHITDKIEQVQSPVELLSLHNASRPLYRSNNRFSKMSGRIRKLVLKGIK